MGHTLSTSPATQMRSRAAASADVFPTAGNPAVGPFRVNTFMGVSKIMGHSWAQISSTGAGNKPECFSEHQKVCLRKKSCVVDHQILYVMI